MPQNQKYLIFAHYHSNGLLRKDIINFLKDSKKIFTKIIFVTTKIHQKELNRIPKKITVIRRKNIGYDFYSYKVGFDYLIDKFKKKFEDKDLYFANSSVLFIEPKKILNSIKKVTIKKNEFWGVSRSRELTDHIQSYFFFLFI